MMGEIQGECEENGGWQNPTNVPGDKTHTVIETESKYRTHWTQMYIPMMMQVMMLMGDDRW